MKLCRETSSVKIVWAVCAPAPYALVVCVVEGFNLDSKNRACEPLASQMMNLGNGNLSWTSSCSVKSAKRIPFCLGILAHPCVFLRLFEYAFEILITLLILVASLSPFSDCFSVIDQDLEKCIK